MQHPIICPLVFGEEIQQPIIQLTTGWLLGDIKCFDKRVHTPLSGFRHYPMTYEVVSLFVSAWRNTEGDSFRFPKILFMESSRRGRMQRLHTIIGGMTSSLTSSLLISCGCTWSMGPNGFVWWTKPRSMICPCYLFFGWGSLIGRLPMTIFTKRLKQSGMEPPSHFISYPG